MTTRDWLEVAVVIFWGWEFRSMHMKLNALIRAQKVEVLDQDDQ
jgi:hypothetical protein